MSGTGHTWKAASTSGKQYIDGLISGNAWGDATVFYNFPNSAAVYTYPGYTSGFKSVSKAQKDAAHFALAGGSAASKGFSVEGFTDLNFTFDSSQANAHIRLAQNNTQSTASAFYPGTSASSGDVWFGTNNNYRNPDAGDYAWHTMLHELGHALGLKHGHESGGNGALPANMDTMEYSVMTYRSYKGGPTNGYTNESSGYAQSYMMLDIAALQHMYGADYTTNSGNTVYSWKPGSGDTRVNGKLAIDADGNRIFATIWDGGGKDTYDLSSYSSDLKLDLRPGKHSVFSNDQRADLDVFGGHDARGNIFNAKLYKGNDASLIENATGGRGDDKIRGNDVKNVLKGMAGNDLLIGADGNDVLVGSGGRDKLVGGSNDDKLKAGSGNDKLFGGGGGDILKGSGGNDILRGDKGDDKLFGQSGDDRFIFNDGFGKDMIVGFDPGSDVIDLRPHKGLNKFSDLTIKKNGGDALIDLGTDEITLDGVNRGALDADDFLL